MKITTITVRYGRTQSLEQYSNVRPEITIGAELDEGEDPEAARVALLGEARAFVEEAVDAALEGDGRTAKFSTEPRYQVIYTDRVYRGAWSREQRLEPPERLIIILPNLPTLERPRRDDGLSKCWWQHPNPIGQKLRLRHAIKIAEEYIAEHANEGYRLIDASDGDLSKVPAWVFEPVPEPAPAPVVAGLPDDDERDGIADAYDDDEGDDDDA